jgi:hypothetical protein
VIAYADKPTLTIEQEDGTHVSWVAELVHPADDPSKDPIWTVREVEPKPAAADGNIVVKFGDSFWLYPSNMGNGYGRLDWARVKNSKVIGSVPGTPAWTAWCEGDLPGMGGAGFPAHTDTRGLSDDDYCRDMAQALGMTRADTSWDELVDEARRVAVHARRDERAEGHARETCTLNDCVAAPWHDKTDECGPQRREPRVFQSDGPEPPADVEVVEWLLERDPNGYQYVRRVGDGWLWSLLPHEQAPTVDAAPASWKWATHACKGTYREVLPT